MVPLRDQTTLGLLDSFRAILAQAPEPLACVDQGELAGQDDWDDDEESSHVQCWWGVFCRQIKT